MNTRESDITHLIRRYGPMTSAELQGHLTHPQYGYNLEVEQISKIASKMKRNGLLVGEDRPNPGTKPVRYWSLPEPVVNDQMTTEMASDVAECEQDPYDRVLNLADNTYPLPPDTPKEKSPMSAAKILREFANLGFDDDRTYLLGAFMDGIAAAERHHGIAE